MQERLRTALLGGLIGAALAVALMTVAVILRIVPLATDARLQSYLLAHPKIVFEMAARAQAQDAEDASKAQQTAVDKLGQKAFFNPEIAFITGPANAKNTVVEFFDYNCVHCRNTAATVKKFFEAHKANTRFAFIEYPIRGEESMAAARIALAARQQGDKYIALHFGLMAESAMIDEALLLKNAKAAGIDMKKLAEDVGKPAVEKALLGVTRLASNAKLSGTPVFIINGTVHEGEITEAELKKLVK